MGKNTQQRLAELVTNFSSEVKNYNSRKHLYCVIHRGFASNFKLIEVYVCEIPLGQIKRMGYEIIMITFYAACLVGLLTMARERK